MLQRTYKQWQCKAPEQSDMILKINAFVYYIGDCCKPDDVMAHGFTVSHDVLSLAQQLSLFLVCAQPLQDCDFHNPCLFEVSV